MKSVTRQYSKWDSFWIYFNRYLLSIGNMLYIGCHTYFVLTEIFKRPVIEAVAYIVIIELLMYKIGKCGLSNWKVWLAKVLIFVCSVGFSIFGHVSEVLIFEETTLINQPVVILETKDVKIAEVKLKIKKLKKLLKTRESNHSYYLERGEKAAYKNSSGASVSGFTAMKVNNRKMERLKSDITIASARIDILEAENNNVAAIKTNSRLQNQNNQKANSIAWWRVVIKNSLAALAILVAGLCNLFLTNEFKDPNVPVTVIENKIHPGNINNKRKHNKRLKAFETAKQLEYDNFKKVKEGKKSLLAYCFPFLNHLSGSERSSPRLE